MVGSLRCSSPASGLSIRPRRHPVDSSGAGEMAPGRRRRSGGHRETLRGIDCGHATRGELDRISGTDRVDQRSWRSDAIREHPRAIRRECRRSAGAETHWRTVASVRREPRSRTSADAAVPRELALFSLPRSQHPRSPWPAPSTLATRATAILPAGFRDSQREKVMRLCERAGITRAVRRLQ